MILTKTKKILFASAVLFGILMSQTQTQLWYQKSGGNIGAVMNVLVKQGIIFCSVYQTGIYRSLDTGKTWQQIAPYTDGVWSMKVRSNGDIIASLWSYGVFKSTDNGSTWTQISANKLYSDVRAINANDEIFIESAGKLFYSADQDTSWIELPVAGGIVTVSENKMYAAKGKTIFRSTNNGRGWNQFAELNAPIYSLDSDSSGKVVAGIFCDNENIQPSIFSYDNQAETWNNNGPQSTINSIIRRKDGVLFAAAHDSGFYFSTNNGAEWKQYNIGLSTEKIYSLALLNDTTIVAGTLDGIFFSFGPLNSLLPVELVSFSAAVKNSVVELRWNTATEINNFGFDIERRIITTNFSQLPESQKSNAWTKIGFVEGNGTSNVPHDYIFFDNVLQKGIYQYRLKQIDRDGNFSYSKMIEVTVLNAPKKFLLEQNFPNPFNPATTITFTLPVSATVVLNVFDITGKHIAELVNEYKHAGEYSVQFNAQHLPSGIYFYTLRAGSLFSAKKMLLVR